MTWTCSMETQIIVSLAAVYTHGNSLVAYKKWNSNCNDKAAFSYPKENVNQKKMFSQASHSSLVPEHKGPVSSDCLVLQTRSVCWAFEKCVSSLLQIKLHTTSCLDSDVPSLLESVYHRFTGVRFTPLAAGQAESSGIKARQQCLHTNCSLSL